MHPICFERCNFLLSFESFISIINCSLICHLFRNSFKVYELGMCQFHKILHVFVDYKCSLIFVAEFSICPLNKTLVVLFTLSGCWLTFNLLSY